RLLAYHTVENIGIIFIGLGLALAFEASGLRAAAALAFAAAIFHVFNHSLFKSLLFMGSGAVLNATGERDMERLGGLIKAMPATASAAETDRCSQIAMLSLALLCLLAGILPGFVIDSLGAVTQMAVGARLAPQSGQAWLRIVPIDIHRSAYSGLLVFVMILLAAAATAFAVRRVASHALRRSAAWDCGFPDASPATQYTAGSFAQ